ncbi:uncharacterized protein [Periplaneta americana]|uniref:uncharacterized protein n=1 Tax=Periplaneta americana TaxID=6978 RepID=UPI0037E77EEF
MRTVLLCVAVAVVAKCDGASLRPGAPPQRATRTTMLRLTAQRNDTGFWTTKFGDYQMTIEHNHFNTSVSNHDGGGTWTLKVKHTATTYQNEEEEEVEDGMVLSEPKFEALQQLASDIDNLVGDEKIQPQAMAIVEPTAEVTTTTEEPYIVGVIVDMEPKVNGDEEDADDGELYDELSSVASEQKGEDDERLRDEQEEAALQEERKFITERYPRSRALITDQSEYEHYNKGYEYHEGVGWIKLNTSHWQWPEARQGCEDEGAHLAVPDTLLKISVFRQLLKYNADILKRAVLKNQVFVGVYDPDRSRKLVTVVHGEPFQPESESFWFPNEPNNANAGEECVTLHLEGKLRDVPCFYNLPFICQID